MRKVYVEAGTDIAQELYLAVVLDRGAQRLAVMMSPAGGMDIEEVAEKTPEKIFTTHIEPGQSSLGLPGQKALFRLWAWSRPRSTRE